jgi:transcription termination factor Rho
MIINLKQIIQIEEEKSKIGQQGIKDQVFLKVRENLLKEPKSVEVDGIVEIMSEGFGFIRQYGLNTNFWDVYIPHSIIRNNDIRTGDMITGVVASPKDTDRNFSLLEVLLINGSKSLKNRPKFENLEAIYPTEQIKLECTSLSKEKNKAMRIVDIFAPIGRGNRCLIAAPPKTGKTEMLHSIAASVCKNYPDIILMVLLIDERPEEVGLMKKIAGAQNVFSSTFDEPSQKHVQLAELAIARAKRLVELKHHVVVLIDSLTRLTRAYNNVTPSSGKVLTGGLDTACFQKPKMILGAARNTEEGGSLTIVSTILVETNSRMDGVIFEEYKGTCNQEIVLDRAYAERRIFPAINLESSGTRGENFMIDSKILGLITTIRMMLQTQTKSNALEMIIKNIEQTKTNEEFFKIVNTKG